MIFVTVGTQLPFERLVQAVDRWAIEQGRGDVFAQIGPTERAPGHIDWKHSLTPREFRACIEEAEAVIAHAGMGTILTALELRRPLLVMPRRADLGEQRNDHQLATARMLSERGLVTAVYDEVELLGRLARLDSLARGPELSPTADTELLETLSDFLS